MFYCTLNNVKSVWFIYNTRHYFGYHVQSSMGDSCQNFWYSPVYYFPVANPSRSTTSPFDLRELSMKRIILGDFCTALVIFLTEEFLIHILPLKSLWLLFRNVEVILSFKMCLWDPLFRNNILWYLICTWHFSCSDRLPSYWQMNSTAEPGYKEIELCDTSYITSDIRWHQLIPNCWPRHTIRIE